MRYEVRFCNGSWAIFDTYKYCPVESGFRLYKDAVEKLNAP